MVCQTTKLLLIAVTFSTNTVQPRLIQMYMAQAVTAFSLESQKACLLMIYTTHSVRGLTAIMIIQAAELGRLNIYQTYLTMYLMNRQQLNQIINASVPPRDTCRKDSYEK